MNTDISTDIAVAEIDAPEVGIAKHPSDPILADHVAEIRRLGKRAVEDVIEIGRRALGVVH